MTHKRGLSDGWEVVELDYMQNHKEVKLGLAEAPPNMMFEGELPIAKYLHVGEAVCKVPTGTLYLTTAALYFYSSWFAEAGEGLSIVPTWSVDKVKLYKNARQQIRLCKDESLTFSYVIKIFCKHLRCIKFCFDELEPASLFQFQLGRTCFSMNQRDSFAFQNKSFLANPDSRDGWTLYSLDREFYRMKLDTKSWRITSVNSSFGICESYPSRFIVPSSVSDKHIRQMSEFRSSGRVIALSWYHAESGAVICRSSQPKVGVLGVRNKSDEKMIRKLQKTNPGGLRIIDCRSRLNAFANVAIGGGTENENNYGNCELDFVGIDNIHGMREALHSLFKQNSPAFAQNWLKGVDSILKSSVSIATDIIHNSKSILVHCSDGWDRTSQVCSVSQLLLDPYYRTLEGFEILIEKEWLSFGHKFADRCGHGLGSFWENNERSPIFVQFMDCVFQLLVTEPNEFQFNEQFLIDILDNMYNCWFGTFLYNNCSERDQARVRLQTPSLWTFLNHPDNIGVYLNDAFKQRRKYLYQKVARVRPQLWCTYFYRTKGIFLAADPYQEVKQFVDDDLTGGKNLVSRACRKFGQYFGKSPGNQPVVRQASDTPVLVAGEEGAILLDSFVCIEDYIPQ